MTQPPPDYLMIIFSIATMIMIAIMGFALLSCSATFHRESGQVDGNNGSKTDFSIQTRI